MGHPMSILCSWLVLHHTLVTILGRSVEPTTITTGGTLDKLTVDLQSFSESNRSTRVSSGVDVASMFGFSIEYKSNVKSVEYINGAVHAFEGLEITLQVFGLFTQNTSIIYSDVAQCMSGNYSHSHVLTVLGTGTTTGIFTQAIVPLVVLPARSLYSKIYFCLQISSSSSPSDWIPQNPDLNIHIMRAHRKEELIETTVSREISFIPLWIQLIFIAILLLLCGLMSGLNLGLMSITKTEMEIILNTGNLRERKYAERVRPLRLKGNQLLCCILLSNVMVNATLATLVDRIISGFVSIIISTLVIVVIGEIVPQAVCMKHGLAVSAKTIYVTKFFMVVTWPVAWPLGKVLDFLVGEESGPVYTRDRLKELLKITEKQTGLDPLELGLIYGALHMKKKTVRYKMRRLDDVFMLPVDTVLDYHTMHVIAANGMDYIPVYEKRRTNIVAVLHISQLILVNPADQIRLQSLLDTHLFRVPDSMGLDSLLKEFASGQRNHIAFVFSRTHHSLSPKPSARSIFGDNSHCVGVITMMDVMQQIFGIEIRQGQRTLTYSSFNICNGTCPETSQSQLPNFCILASLQFIASNVLPHLPKSLKPNRCVSRVSPQPICVYKPCNANAKHVNERTFVQLPICNEEVEINDNYSQVKFSSGKRQNSSPIWSNADSMVEVNNNQCKTCPTNEIKDQTKV